MRIEFAYAQARAQAQNGARPGANGWRVLDASRTLAQFLHAARTTSLAPYLAHLTAVTPPHAIERSLRRDWREIVAAAASWVPEQWRHAIEWTAQLPDLPAHAYLAGGGDRLDWMAEDSALAGAAEGRGAVLRDVDPAGREPTDASRAVLADWLAEWRRRWPAVSAAEAAALEDLARLLGRHRDARLNADLSPEGLNELVGRLQTRCTRLLRSRRQQPAAVFCHLALAGMDLWRLRAGLIRRALANVTGEIPT